MFEVLEENVEKSVAFMKLFFSPRTNLPIDLTRMWSKCQNVLVTDNKDNNKITELRTIFIGFIKWMIWAQKTSLIPSPFLLMCFTKPGIYVLGVSILPFSMLFRLDFVKVPIMWYFLFFILYFRLLTDFVCLYTYEFWEYNKKTKPH
jgi:hypothetical protein